MSTIQHNRRYDRHDCGAIREVRYPNGNSALFDPDEYVCQEGIKGSGEACAWCEMTWAWWQLDQAQQALDAAGVARPYPELMLQDGTIK